MWACLRKNMPFKWLENGHTCPQCRDVQFQQSNLNPDRDTIDPPIAGSQKRVTIRAPREGNDICQPLVDLKQRSRDRVLSEDGRRPHQLRWGQVCALRDLEIRLEGRSVHISRTSIDHSDLQEFGVSGYSSLTQLSCDSLLALAFAQILILSSTYNVC